uniref:Uncharacterized protein n=1 Tax=Trichuris muris TaxID=70415 RepID=A0A5S6Q309_TRIMR
MGISIAAVDPYCSYAAAKAIIQPALLSRDRNEWDSQLASRDAPDHKQATGRHKGAPAMAPITPGFMVLRFDKRPAVIRNLGRGSGRARPPVDRPGRASRTTNHRTTRRRLDQSPSLG